MASGGFNTRKKGTDCMNWIPITAESKKHIRVGDFISATYGMGIIYKVLGFYNIDDEMLLDVGVCDKYGNIENEDWTYFGQSITCFDCYSQRNRKAMVV